MQPDDRRPCDVSVVLCTYNRSDRLPAALDALLQQDGDVPYEVIVVDNNSTDATATVVQTLAPLSGGRLRYAFESRQGLSYARNRGIEMAHAPIVAFTDDDVRVAPDWVAEVARTFDAHPEIDFVGGRILPRWQEPPPAWLTTAHWSPLALQDYGRAAFVTSRDRAICLVGANLTFRRRVFDRVGGFAPELGRIKEGIGSTEDYDMQLRAWRASMRGLYQPDLAVVADVTPDRLEKAYHRRWHRGNGRHCAAMRVRELVPADMGPVSEPKDIVSLFGSPAFVWADLLRYAGLWVRALVRREDTFFYANKLRHVWSYVQTRRKIHREEAGRDLVAEVLGFVKEYYRKRWARRAVRT